jgi:hypothetical protein
MMFHKKYKKYIWFYWVLVLAVSTCYTGNTGFLSRVYTRYRKPILLASSACIVGAFALCYARNTYKKQKSSAPMFQSYVRAQSCCDQDCQTGSIISCEQECQTEVYEHEENEGLRALCIEREDMFNDAQDRSFELIMRNNALQKQIIELQERCDDYQAKICAMEGKIFAREWSTWSYAQHAAAEKLLHGMGMLEE